MQRFSMAAVLLSALTIAAVHAAAASTTSMSQMSYERPLNSDCIVVKSGVLPEGVALFPDNYQLIGDESTKEQSYTQITTARGFDVKYYPGYKVVTNKIANETYVLYQCGVPQPAASKFPAGTKFFSIPLASISAPETVPYAFLELLGLDDRVYDVSPFVTSPCGQKLLSCNRTGIDFMQLENTTAIQSTLGPYVDSVLTTSPYSSPLTFAFSASEDPGLLNRVEWIKFLGLFFNRERQASQIFDGIANAYNETKTAAAKAAGKTRPTVAFITHFSYDGDENYQFSFAPYQIQGTSDAGGQMIDIAKLQQIKGVNASNELSETTIKFDWNGTDAGFADKATAQAAFLKALEGVDVIIDETYAMDPTAYTYDTFLTEYGIDPKSAEAARLPWLKNKAIYRTDGLVSPDGGSDWFETAFARPDQALADLLRALHPTAVKNATAHRWIRKIDEAPKVLTADSCSRIKDCNKQSAAICPFVQLCPNDSPALLQADDADSTTCKYASCAAGGGSAINGTNTLPAANTATMAAPAVVLFTVLVVFVEMLINFC